MTSHHVFIESSAPPDYTPTQPVVAFDIAMGKRGIEYDVDLGLVREGLLAGGIQEEDIAKHPLIIRQPASHNFNGLMTRSSTLNSGNPAIELFTGNTDGIISTRTVAHESKHLADLIYTGKEAFFDRQDIKIRKIAASLAALAFTAPLFEMIIVAGYPIVSDLGLGIALATSSTLASSLHIEYLRRPEEIRARKHERTVDHQNILITTPEGAADGRPRYHIAKKLYSLAKHFLIPNYGR